MQKGTITKYALFKAIGLKDRTWPDRSIRQAPIWASVDLRDGNQALAIPMTVEEKIEFFELLNAGTNTIDLTGIRLDALPNEKLPKGGSGLAHSGNFVLSRIRLARTDIEKSTRWIVYT